MSVLILGVVMAFAGAAVLAVAMTYRVTDNWCSCGRVRLVNGSVTLYSDDQASSVHEAGRCYFSLEDVV